MFPKSSHLIFLVVIFALLTPGWSSPKFIDIKLEINASPQTILQINTHVQYIISTAWTNDLIICGNNSNSIGARNPINVTIDTTGLTTEINFGYNGLEYNNKLEISRPWVGSQIAVWVQCDGSLPVAIPSKGNVEASAQSITNIIEILVGLLSIG